MTNTQSRWTVADQELVRDALVRHFRSQGWSPIPERLLEPAGAALDALAAAGRIADGMQEIHLRETLAKRDELRERLEASEAIGDALRARVAQLEGERDVVIAQYSPIVAAARALREVWGTRGIDRPTMVTLVNAVDAAYPNGRRSPEPSDPTHGCIDPDIQQVVEEMNPTSIGQRVAIENTLQALRDKRIVDHCLFCKGPLVECDGRAVHRSTGQRRCPVEARTEGSD